MERVSNAWPEERALREGKEWLENYYMRKKFDSPGFLNLFLNELKPYESQLKEQNLLFLTREDFPLFTKLGFSSLYPKLSEVEFKNLASHFHTFWKLGSIFQKADLHTQTKLDCIVRQFMQKMYTADLHLSKGLQGLDPEAIAKMTAGLLGDEQLHSNIIGLATDMTIGKAAQLFSVVGVESSDIHNLAKKVMAEVADPESQEEIEEDFSIDQLLLNPSEDIRNKTLGEILDSNELFNKKVKKVPSQAETKVPPPFEAPPKTRPKQQAEPGKVKTAEIEKSKGKKKKPKKKKAPVPTASPVDDNHIRSLLTKLLSETDFVKTLLPAEARTGLGLVDIHSFQSVKQQQEATTQ